MYRFQLSFNAVKTLRLLVLLLFALALASTAHGRGGSDSQRRETRPDLYSLSSTILGTTDDSMMVALQEVDGKIVAVSEDEIFYQPYFGHRDSMTAAVLDRETQRVSPIDLTRAMGVGADSIAIKEAWFTDFGIVFKGNNFYAGSEFTVFTWRNGTLVPGLWTGSTVHDGILHLAVDGPIAIWVEEGSDTLGTSDPRVFWSDHNTDRVVEVTDEIRVSLSSLLLDVGPDGSAALSGGYMNPHISGNQIYVFKDDTTRTVSADGQLSDLQVENGLLAYTSVRFYTDCGGGGYDCTVERTMLRVGSESEVLSRFEYSSGGTRLLAVQLENGWAAYYDEDVAGKRHIWRRSPSGDRERISSTDGTAKLETLSPIGELTFSYGGRRFVASNGAAYDIGRFVGEAIWLNDQWFIIAGNTLYELRPLTTSIHQENPDIPKHPIDLEVYPNPLVERATIAIETKRTESLQIEIYDALGRKVATLFEGVVPSTERREFVVDSDVLPSGFYLIRVRGESFTTAVHVISLK